MDLVVARRCTINESELPWTTIRHADDAISLRSRNLSLCPAEPAEDDIVLGPNDDDEEDDLVLGDADPIDDNVQIGRAHV